MSGFGSRVREFRMQLGMTQAEFGEALGVKRQYVANVENGQKLFSHDLLAKARRLGADLNWLVPDPLEANVEDKPTSE